MNIFDEIDDNLFRPLTGINNRKLERMSILEQCNQVMQESIKAIELIE